MSKLKFEVVFCSGEDPDYPATELNTHSPHTKGWQSPRFCEYPQEIGLALEHASVLSRVQILSHQSKITTKIELFVGEGVSYQHARFTRLGYLSLNNNQRSNYQARELKSVYINCNADFLKLVIHRCFINKYNLFNQVGLIAVNIIGSYGGNRENAAYSSPIVGLEGASMSGSVQERPIHSGKAFNDISFDMNFDSDTARQIRAVAAAKDRAVKVEDYDLAKHLKTVELRLKAIGGQIAQLEVSKKQAVQVEDYDRAKTLKAEIDVLREQIGSELQTYINDPKLNLKGVEPESRVIKPNHDLAGHSLAAAQDPHRPLHGSNSPVHEKSMTHLHPEEHDEIPVGAQQYFNEESNNENDAAVHNPSQFLKYRPASREIHPAKAPNNAENNIGVGVIGHDEELRMGGDEMESANNSNGPVETFDGPHPLSDIPGYETFPTPEQLKQNVADSSEVQGLKELGVSDYILRCLYSKEWTLRHAAISKIKDLIPEISESAGIGQALPLLCNVLKIGVDDRIDKVFFDTMLLASDIFDQLNNLSIKRGSQNNLIDYYASNLTNRLSDGTQRIREGASHGLFILAHCNMFGPGLVTHYAIRKLNKKQAAGWRPVEAHLLLLMRLVSKFGWDEGSGMVSPDSIMKFAADCNAFTHSQGKARDAAKLLTLEVYRKTDEATVEKWLTNLRPKQLQEYYDDMDKIRPCERNLLKGKVYEHVPIDHGQSNSRPTDENASSNHNIHHNRTPSAQNTHRSHGTEASSLSPVKEEKQKHSKEKEKQSANASPKQSSSTPVPMSPSARDKAHSARGSPAASKHNSPKKQLGSPKSDDLNDSVENTCRFCNRYDPNFTTDNLDLHYYHECQMLMLCHECEQIIEIMCLPEHLLTECDNKDKYVQCDLTGMAVLKTKLKDWKKSPQYKKPNLGEDGIKCALCYTDVPEGEEAFRDHILTSCKKNPRGKPTSENKKK